MREQKLREGTYLAQIHSSNWWWGQDANPGKNGYKTWTFNVSRNLWSKGGTSEITNITLNFIAKELLTLNKI